MQVRPPTSWAAHLGLLCIYLGLLGYATPRAKQLLPGYRIPAADEKLNVRNQGVRVLERFKNSDPLILSAFARNDNDQASRLMHPFKFVGAFCGTSGLFSSSTGIGKLVSFP
jgi:hypothetical protein